MALYLLERTDHADYDEVRKAVVIATDWRNAVMLLKTFTKQPMVASHITIAEVPPHAKWRTKVIASTDPATPSGVVLTENNWG